MKLTPNAGQVDMPGVRTNGSSSVAATLLAFALGACSLAPRVSEMSKKNVADATSVTVIPRDRDHMPADLAALHLEPARVSTTDPATFHKILAGLVSPNLERISKVAGNGVLVTCTDEDKGIWKVDLSNPFPPISLSAQSQYSIVHNTDGTFDRRLDLSGSTPLVGAISLTVLQPVVLGPANNTADVIKIAAKFEPHPLVSLLAAPRDTGGFVEIEITNLSIHLSPKLAYSQLGAGNIDQVQFNSLCEALVGVHEDFQCQQIPSYSPLNGPSPEVAKTLLTVTQEQASGETFLIPSPKFFEGASTDSKLRPYALRALGIVNGWAYCAAQKSDITSPNLSIVAETGSLKIIAIDCASLGAKDSLFQRVVERPEPIALLSHGRVVRPSESNNPDSIRQQLERYGKVDLERAAATLESIEADFGIKLGSIPIVIGTGNLEFSRFDRMGSFGRDDQNLGLSINTSVQYEQGLINLINSVAPTLGQTFIHHHEVHGLSIYDALNQIGIRDYNGSPLGKLAAIVYSSKLIDSVMNSEPAVRGCYLSLYQEMLAFCGLLEGHSIPDPFLGRIKKFMAHLSASIEGQTIQEAAPYRSENLTSLQHSYFSELSCVYKLSPLLGINYFTSNDGAAMITEIRDARQLLTKRGVYSTKDDNSIKNTLAAFYLWCSINRPDWCAEIRSSSKFGGAASPTSTNEDPKTLAKSFGFYSLMVNFLWQYGPESGRGKLGEDKSILVNEALGSFSCVPTNGNFYKGLIQSGHFKDVTEQILKLLERVQKAASSESVK